MSEAPRKSSLLIIFITVFIDLLGFGIVLPLLPRYARYLNATGLELGLLMASFSAMQFVFAPIWGRVSDRVGRRPILILGLAGSCAFYGLFGYVSSFAADSRWLGLTPLAWLFVTRVGAGIAGATIPTAQAYIADVTGRKERGKGMALIGAAFGIGFTFGPLLGAAFVSGENSGPSVMPGYVASVLSGLAMLSAIFVLPESLRSDSHPTDAHILDLGSLRKAMSRPAIARILVTMFLTTFAFAQFESTLSLLTQSLGLGDKSNFYVFAYIGLVLTISQGVLVRRLLPRIGEHRMAMAGVSLMVLGLLLIGVAADSESRALLYSVLPISVIGFSALNPSLQSMLSLRTANTDQGGTLGLGQSMSALARILGPMAGMPLYYWMTTSPYYSASALMVVGLMLVATLYEPSSDEEATDSDSQPEPAM